MSDKSPCPRCKKVGFIRYENVIKARKAERHYYCGACQHSWAVADDGGVTSNLGKPPDRSRNDR